MPWLPLFAPQETVAEGGVIVSPTGWEAFAEWGDASVETPIFLGIAAHDPRMRHRPGEGAEALPAGWQAFGLMGEAEVSAGARVDPRPWPAVAAALGRPAVQAEQRLAVRRPSPLPPIVRGRRLRFAAEASPAGWEASGAMGRAEASAGANIRPAGWPVRAAWGLGAAEIGPDRLAVLAAEDDELCLLLLDDVA